MNNWYDDAANVLALARWMDESGGYLNDTIASVVCHPSRWPDIWQTYQASLQPKEPTLSEEIKQVEASHAERLLNPLTLGGYLVEMAQRIEALEAKVGE